MEKRNIDSFIYSDIHFIPNLFIYSFIYQETVEWVECDIHCYRDRIQRLNMPKEDKKALLTKFNSRRRQMIKTHNKK